MKWENNVFELNLIIKIIKLNAQLANIDMEMLKLNIIYLIYVEP